MARVLILYYSRYGATQQMAEVMANTVDSCAEAVLRTVPAISANHLASEPSIPDSGAVYCTHDDLRSCDALLLGSPTRFGNMAAPMKHFLDSTSNLWMTGALAGKPAAVFTSSASLHGGQESTLLSMMLPLFHHGMLMLGVPPTESELSHTQTGGTPYGASHLAGSQSANALSDSEITICQTLALRVATLANTLKQAR